MLPVWKRATRPLAFDFEDSYQGMPSGVPKADTTVEERRFSAGKQAFGRRSASALR